MKDFRSCLRELLRELRPLGWKVAVSCLIGLMEVALSLAFVWTSKKVVDIATGRVEDSLSTWVVAFVCVLAFQVVVRVAARWWEGRVMVLAQNSRRAGIFARVMNSTWNGRERMHSGDTVNRLEEDIRITTDFLCSCIPDTVTTLVQLVAASVYIFILQPQLAWILILIMPVAVVGSRLFFKRMRRLTGEIRNGDSLVQSFIQENLQHRVLCKTMGSTDGILSNLDEMQDKVRCLTLSRLKYGAVSRAFMNTGFAAGYALVFVWGVYGLQSGAVTYGMMVAFLQLVGQVQRPVANMAAKIPSFIKALASEDRLLDLISLPQESNEPDVRIPGAPGLKVENLVFSYEGDGKQVISGLDFDFKPGTMTAILGPTGAGKSTLIRIFMSLLHPVSGRVLLYTQDRQWENSVGTRCNFMYVPQGNSLMSGSIRQNLLLAKPDADEEQIRQALHLAAADFVYELKDGLDTLCAEVGSGLSEGQAQRIAVARAFLRPGGILILDEATSALDGDTELALLQRLADHYRGNKTIICITHRPAATSFADAVLKLDPGRQNPSL